MMSFRLLAYMVRIWQQFLQQNPGDKRLPAIFPLVLYQGETAWKAARQFEALVDGPSGMRKFIPSFRYELIDLYGMGREEIKGNAPARMCLELMKAERLRQLLEWIRGSGKYWVELSAFSDHEKLLRLCLLYAFEMEESIDSAKQLEVIISEIDHPETRHQAMSIAEILEARGLEKGLQQGLEQGLEQGREEGLERGALIGRVQAFQEMLAHPVTERKVLASMSGEELEKLVMTLASELKNRLS